MGLLCRSVHFHRPWCYWHRYLYRTLSASPRTSNSPITSTFHLGSPSTARCSLPSSPLACTTIHKYQMTKIPDVCTPNQKGLPHYQHFLHLFRSVGYSWTQGVRCWRHLQWSLIVFPHRCSPPGPVLLPQQEAEGFTALPRPRLFS